MGSKTHAESGSVAAAGNWKALDYEHAVLEH